MPRGVVRGINLPFGRLPPCAGQVPYALRTRAPVAGGRIATAPLPLDLHVLGLSLAFILSQDQTLRCMTFVLFYSFRAAASPRAAPRLTCFTTRGSAAAGCGAVQYVNVRLFLSSAPRRGGVFVSESGCKGRGFFRNCKGEGETFYDNV